MSNILSISIIIFVIGFLISLIVIFENIKRKTISQIENVLGAKAKITKASVWYIYMVEIEGGYRGRDVKTQITYNVYEDWESISVMVKLRKEHVEDYYTQNKPAQRGFIQSIKKWLKSYDSYSIEDNYVLMRRLFIWAPGVFKIFNRLLEETIKTAELIENRVI